MDSRTGKKIRLGRILDPVSRRGIVVAASHGVLTGAAAGLRTTADMIHVFEQLNGANGEMVAPGSVGQVEEVFVGRGRPSLVVHLDWKSHGRNIMTPTEEGRSEGTVTSLATIEEVSASGADAVMSTCTSASGTTSSNGARSSGTRAWQPSAPGWASRSSSAPGQSRLPGPEPGRELRAAQRYCRLSAEIGADIVKCIWPGDRLLRCSSSRVTSLANNVAGYS